MDRESNETTLSRCKDGLFLYPKHDNYISRCLDAYGEYSPEELHVLSQLVPPGGVVVEAGAHVGTLTVPLARIAGRIYAFEPQRRIFQMLCANLAMNDVANVWAFNAALGEKDAMIWCRQAKLDETDNTGGVSMLGVDKDKDRVEQVAMRKLDSLKIDFHLLKCDAEDMEIHILQGGEETIRRVRPIMYLEANNTHAPILEFIEPLGYCAFWHFPPLAQQRNFRGNKDNIFEDTVKVSFNLLCVPNERELHTDLIPARAEDDCFELARAYYKRLFA